MSGSDGFFVFLLVVVTPIIILVAGVHSLISNITSNAPSVGTTESRLVCVEGRTKIILEIGDYTVSDEYVITKKDIIYDRKSCSEI
jgi:hypothetical protein